MNQLELSSWETIIKAHLQVQKKRRKSLSMQIILKIVVNLKAVNNGLKPGFLWDIKEAPIQKTQLLNLVTELKRQNLLHSGIYVANVGDEVIVTDLQHISEQCLHLNHFINVTQHLERPVFIQRDSDSSSDIFQMLVSVSEQIIEFLKLRVELKSSVLENRIGTPKDVLRFDEVDPNERVLSNTHNSDYKVCEQYDSDKNLDSDKEHQEQAEATVKKVSDIFLEKTFTNSPHFNLKVHEHWCIPTLLGVFLGYPIVYWYNQALPNSDGKNCLSYVELTVYKIYFEIEDGDRCKDKWYELYSFSAPCCLRQYFDSFIQSWYKNLVEKVNVQTCFFKNLKLHQEIIKLSTVIM